MSEFSEEYISDFLNGRNPQKYIVNMECDYQTDQVSMIINDPELGKIIKRDDFLPFCWAKPSGARKLCSKKVNNEYKQDKFRLKELMNEFGIGVKELKTTNELGITPKKMENSYKLMFYAKRKMTYSNFTYFFRKAGVDLYGTEKEFIAVSPAEQYMIQTGKRMFKGYDDYDELTRLVFDLETEGLDANINRINEIGVRTNKGFEKIISIEGNTKEELDENETKAIVELLKLIKELKPDVISGQNSENFDFPFIITRCEKLGYNFQELSKDYIRNGIYKKNRASILKLGGEVETYFPTVAYGFNITDSLHAIRRVQAQDSSMKKADLKYVTKYLKLNKPNRVYIPGDKIKTLWLDNDNNYAFNENNGLWYKVEDKNIELKEGYIPVNGRYIHNRYLKDDLYETDKVELTCNQSNFLIGKIVPTTFNKSCTMGTAASWKLLMLAWSYENNLAIPPFGEAKSFTGGLSRLIQTGYVKNVVKLDYNSLYPSIILTYLIETESDISGVMLQFLGFMLDQREKYKKQMKKFGKDSDKLKDEYKDNFTKEIEKKIKKLDSQRSSADRKQNPLKIFCNSFFGSFGAPHIFPWGDLVCAEATTCIGRMSFRLMVDWFSKRGFLPIVGDSFTNDTPFYVRDKKTNKIEIKRIDEIFNYLDYSIDYLGREYDYSEKDYEVLCRGGWVDVKYVYRHKVTKDIYRVATKHSYIDVTEDHSLFDKNKNKISPNEILNKNNNIELEFYDKEIDFNDFKTIKSLLSNNKEESLLENATIKYDLKDKVVTAQLITYIRKLKIYYEIDLNKNLLIVYPHINVDNYDDSKVISCNKINNPDENGYVYDICLDGTVVNALGCNIVTQTDGVNFKCPDDLNYEYIGLGLNRQVEKDKLYKGVEAHVAEFNDLFMRGKMGLGIDEYAEATINFSRKNYADLLLNKKTGELEVKLVGNSIKSKKMPVFIERFLEIGVKQLLNGQGKEFINSYYDYIERIYNYKIPLREIASKGKIKKSLQEYKEDCKTLTKAGRPKSRQAWYELAILNNLDVNMGDTIYYINIGDGKKKKSCSDVCKDPKTGEVKLNCFLLPNSIVEAEDDTYCDDIAEYNSPKYIEQFNKRINPLLVCFSQDVRQRIIIKNPEEKQYFTDSECELISGIPNKPEDQDSVEVLLIPEDKEIKYWMSVDKEPNFIKEIGKNWDELKEKFLLEEEERRKDGIKDEVKKYTKVIEGLKQIDVDEIIETGIFPEVINFLCDFDIESRNFISKQYKVKVGDIYDIIDKDFSLKENEENLDD